MTVFTGIVVYLMTFWVTLFAVLPWGNKAPDEKEAGISGGAPLNPRIRQKFIITAIVSAIIWLIIYVLIDMNIIDFYAAGKSMAKEDYGQ